MSDEFKDFTVTPTLTFEPLQEEAPVAEVKKEEPAKPEMDDSILLSLIHISEPTRH